MSRGDNQYLAKRGPTYRVVVPVPRDLQPILNKTKLIQSLHTRDLSTARKLRWDVVPKLKAQIEAARSKLITPLDQFALAHAKKQFTEETKEDAILPLTMAETMSLEDGLSDHEVYNEGILSPRAMRFLQMSEGKLTPFGILESAWAADLQRRVIGKTYRDFRRSVAMFNKFLKATEEDNLESLTDLHVMRWIEALQKQNFSSATVTRHLTGLGNYMKHLYKAGLIPKVYTREKAPSPKPVREDEAFEIEELEMLLRHSSGQMQDAIALAASLGLRSSELFGLKAGDLYQSRRGLALKVQGTKTPSAWRILPVTDLTAKRLRRLAAGKEAGAFLFDTGEPSRNHARGSDVARKFIKFARSLEGIPANRNFHSLRKSFSFLAEAVAEIPGETVSRIMGHSSRQTLAQTGYAGRTILEKFLPLQRHALDRLTASLPPELRDLLEG